QAFVGELDAAVLREPWQHRVERLLLPNAGIKRLLAAKPRRDLQRLASVLAKRRKDVDQELLVWQRVTNLQRGMPRREHRQIVVIEIGDGLGVVRVEL